MFLAAGVGLNDYATRRHVVAVAWSLRPAVRETTAIHVQQRQIAKL